MLKGGSPAPVNVQPFLCDHLKKLHNSVLMNLLWLWQLLAMIGEQFEEGDEICGAVVSVRKAGDKIAIWTKTASNEAAQVCYCLLFQTSVIHCFQVSMLEVSLSHEQIHTPT